MANPKMSEVRQPKPRLMLRQARPNLPAGNRKRVTKSHKPGRNITADMLWSTYQPVLQALSGAARVEAAAERAIEIGARTYGSVKSILDNKLDRRPAPKRPAETAPIRHPNIRGPRYYH